MVNDNKGCYQGFFLPTGGIKPPPIGYDKSDRFDRLPKKIGQIQISNKKRQFNRLAGRLDRWTGPVWVVTDQIQFFLV